ncbi:hypothetical protein LSH36_216g01004 [Paralvinella palmiformis]|uniref:Uncharacterized protein n=1 Tax=Paralvinella palmiformis TaxID=53620 RepID=A0AAD9JN76_9ANNE|nr:hypothetical protein LSH36_216g01004 [Paralvinella palmiformis]
MSYDIDEFEALMEASRMGGSSVRHFRLSRSLPSSPLSSPKRSPEPEGEIQSSTIQENVLCESIQESTAYSNLLLPPDPLYDLQPQANGTPGGARPKVAPLCSGSTKEVTSSGIRRSQSCRRPANTRRDQSQISYRQRAHANAWRQHASTTSGEEDPEGKSPEAVGADSEPEVAKMAANDGADLEDCKIYRVRSFRMTSSGIVNRGDSFKVRSRRQSAKQRTPRTPRTPHGTHRRYSMETSDSQVSRDDLLSIAESTISLGTRSPTRPTILNVHESPRTGSYDTATGSQSDTTGSRSYRDQFLSVGGTLEPEIEVDEEIDEEVNEPAVEDEDEGVVEEGDEDPDEDESPVFKVVVIGSQGVGKTTLTSQLLTSEYLANTDRYQDDDNEKIKIVSVQLDEEESTVQFINVQNFEEAKQLENVDAYVVVFSVTDRNSFAYAHACLQDLTKKGAPSRKKVTIVVANKQDIMRNRVITEHEARSLASHRNCKYTEVSALLDHKVDELLVGIIRQIRMKQAKQQQQQQHHHQEQQQQQSSGRESSDFRRIGCLQRAAVGLFRRLFRKRSSSGKTNCDNLLSP